MVPAQNTVPYQATPRATWTLIGACVAVFCCQLTLSEAAAIEFLNRYALVPQRYFSSTWAAAHGVARGDPIPLFSSMFLHGGVLHILFNLWTLWVFGPALEERLGAGRFVVLYIASGLAAGVLHAVFNASSAVPALGASGAIAGVLAAYARRFPYAWVNVLQPIAFLPVLFMMPALLFAGLWFGSQMLQATGALATPSSGGGVAWWAHIGGFLAGCFLLARLAPPSNATEEMTSAARSALWPIEAWQRWMRWWMRR